MFMCTEFASCCVHVGVRVLVCRCQANGWRSLRREDCVSLCSLIPCGIKHSKRWWTAAELTGKVLEYKSAAHNWSELVQRNKHSDVFYGFSWERKSIFPFVCIYLLQLFISAEMCLRKHLHCVGFFGSLMPLCSLLLLNFVPMFMLIVVSLNLWWAEKIFLKVHFAEISQWT